MIEFSRAESNNETYRVLSPRPLSDYPLDPKFPSLRTLRMIFLVTTYLVKRLPSNCVQQTEENTTSHIYIVILHIYASTYLLYR